MAAGAIRELLRSLEESIADLCEENEHLRDLLATQPATPRLGLPINVDNPVKLINLDGQLGETPTGATGNRIVRRSSSSDARFTARQSSDTSISLQSCADDCTSMDMEQASMVATQPEQVLVEPNKLEKEEVHLDQSGNDLHELPMEHPEKAESLSEIASAKDEPTKRRKPALTSAKSFASGFSGACSNRSNPDSDNDGLLLPHWDETNDNAGTESLDLEDADLLILETNNSVLSSKTGDVIRNEGCLQRLVLHPGDRKRVAWDVLSIALMAYDIVLTPMSVFGIHHVEMLPWFAWFIVCFWSVDVVMTCFVGYYQSGLLEMRPRMIVRRYLGGWMLMDIIIVVADIAFLLGGAKTILARMARLTKTTRVLRVLKMLRLLRLLRVIKMATVMNHLDQIISHQYLFVFFRVSRNMLTIVFFNHYIACGWFAVGQETSQSTGYRAWTTSMRSDTEEDAEPSYFFLYTTSLHWALTQFTPASMEVFPMNPWERIYNIFVLIFAVLIFSSVVGGITSAMTSLANLNAEKNKQMEKLQRYVLEHRISVDLANRVQTYLVRQTKSREDHPVLECQVPILSILPEKLRWDLKSEVHQNILMLHPLFVHLAMTDSNGVLVICHKAMSEESLKTGSFLWKQGRRAKGMYYLKRGELRVQANSKFRHATRFWPSVDAGAWMSEIALWLMWHYRLHMSATVDSELFSVAAHDFARIATKFSRMEIVKLYARQYALHFENDGCLMSEALLTHYDKAKTMVSVAREELAFTESRTIDHMSSLSSGVASASQKSRLRAASFWRKFWG